MVGWVIAPAGQPSAVGRRGQRWYQGFGEPARSCSRNVQILQNLQSSSCVNRSL